MKRCELSFEMTSVTAALRVLVQDKCLKKVPHSCNSNLNIDSTVPVFISTAELPALLHVSSEALTVME